uniref:Uncharacterized protein n=1 Tax=Panagrolaimus sp. PS1159 TaxID=55785 RepID=A0AC35GN88_9BILA
MNAPLSSNQQIDSPHLEQEPRQQSLEQNVSHSQQLQQQQQQQQPQAISSSSQRQQSELQQQAEPHPQQHQIDENKPITYGERGSSRKSGDLFYVKRNENEFYCLTKYDKQSHYVCRSCQKIRRERKKKQSELELHQYFIDENNGIHGHNDPRDAMNHYCKPLTKEQILTEGVKRDFFTDSERPVGAGINELMTKVNKAVSNESLRSKIKDEILKNEHLEKNIKANERRHIAKKHGQNSQIVTRQKAKTKRSFGDNDDEEDEEDDEDDDEEEDKEGQNNELEKSMKNLNLKGKISFKKLTKN